MNRALRLIEEFHRTPWAILPETLTSIEMILYRWAEGIKLSQEEIHAAVGDAPALTAARRAREGSAGNGVIAVLPVFGVIGQRASLVADSSSGINTSTELLGRAFAAMVADPGVVAIVLDVDSPGGSVFGVNELADQIFGARGSKPIVAVANSTAASAAYWIASSADEIAIAPGGEIGSIGVLAAHKDRSKMFETGGVKTTLIYAGKYKAEGNPYEPLGPEARDYIQSRVDEYYGDFVRTVARNRRDTQTNVREGYGQGRVMGAQAAIKANLADRIATLDQVITDLAKSVRARGARAEASAAEVRSEAPATPAPTEAVQTSATAATVPTSGREKRQRWMDMQNLG